MERTEPLELEMTPATSPASRTRRSALAAPGSARVQSPTGGGEAGTPRASAAPPRRVRGGVVRQVAGVAAGRGGALGGIAAGQMRVEAHAGRRLGLLHL